MTHQLGDDAPTHSTDPVAQTDTDAAAEPSPWRDLDSFQALPRLGGIELAPDGSWLLATISQLNLDKTAFTSSLWRIAVDGSSARRLTRGVEGESGTAILSDGSVVFTSTRALPKQSEDDSDDAKALWCLPSSGGEAYVLARRVGGWSSVMAAKKADLLVAGIGMPSGVVDQQAEAERLAERKKRKVDAIVHSGYPVRYWDHDLDTNTTRFVPLPLRHSPSAGEWVVDPAALSADVIDNGYGISPNADVAADGSFLLAEQAVRESRGASRGRIVTIDVTTSQLTPLADDDGIEWGSALLNQAATLAVASRHPLSTPEAMADQVLYLVDVTSGAQTALAADWDRWADPVAFSPDDSTVFVTADDDGQSPIFAIEVATGQVRRLTDEGAFSSVQLSDDGATLYAVRTSYADPGTIVSIDVDTGTVTELHRPITEVNLPGRLERIETTAADGSRIPAWLCLPESASDDQPAPLALWIHGGPLGSWNAWSWRWCPWLLVSQGYAVLLPDPALSTGYGLDFINRGWGDWGGNSFTDLMAITDAAESRSDIADGDSIAMGGSYGGYMANWVAGHTDRFRAIVTHASLWNLTSFGATTDASWYWNREMTPQMQAANSPHNHIEKITTPMLVIHGDKDYRVPIGEGLALWWALNEHWQGPLEAFPHRFLYFPNENHWVLTPQHASVWYHTVLEFLASVREGREFVTPALL